MLDDLAQAAKNKMIEEKRKRAELADKKYEKVLEQFLDKAKVSKLSFCIHNLLCIYHAIEL